MADVKISALPAASAAAFANEYAINEAGTTKKVTGQQIATMIATLGGVHGSDIASASTLNLDTATGDLVDVTGTTTITAVTLTEGRTRLARHTGAQLLTHGSSLVLNGSANITTVAGDYVLYMGYAAGVVRAIHYPVTVTGTGSGVRATGPTLVTPTLGVATATTINKVALTAPATGSTITVADSATLTVSASATISSGTHSGTNTGDRSDRDRMEWIGPAINTYIGGTLLTIGARTYAVYLGYFAVAKTILYVRADLTTAGSSTQVAEVGLASSPLAPNGASQTLTFLVADGTLDDLTTGAPKMVKNVTAFNTTGYAVAANTHLWALFRGDMAGTECTFAGAAFDQTRLGVLQADAVGALTSLTPGVSTISGVTHVGGLTGSAGPFLIATTN
jgi:hypothetical protein